eukprot:204330_1
MRRESKIWRMKRVIKPKILINNFNGYSTKIIDNVTLLYPHNIGLRGTYHINQHNHNMNSNLSILDNTYWDKYRSNCKSLGIKLNQLYFLDICRNNHNIIPKGFQVKTKLQGIRRNRDIYIQNKLINKFERGISGLRKSILKRDIRNLYKDIIPKDWEKIQHLFVNQSNEHLLLSLNCAIATVSLVKEKEECNKLFDLGINYILPNTYAGDENKSVDYIYIDDQ